MEDRPLALCDSRSVHPQDLVATDRIIPSLVRLIVCLASQNIYSGTLPVFLAYFTGDPDALSTGGRGLLYDLQPRSQMVQPPSMLKYTT